MPLVLTADANPGTASWSDADVSHAVTAAGTATVLNGQTSVVVAVGAALNGSTALVSFGEAPTAASLAWAGPVAGGNLTINIDVDNTADLDISYAVLTSL